MYKVVANTLYGQLTQLIKDETGNKVEVTRRRSPGFIAAL